jgi:hypothetical protein
MSLELASVRHGCLASTKEGHLVLIFESYNIIDLQQLSKIKRVYG